MPMLSPLVWVLHAPDYAIRLECPVEAARIVREEGLTVCLPSYDAGARTLDLLGSTPENTERLLAAARKMPQWQHSYDPGDVSGEDQSVAGHGGRTIRSHSMVDLAGQVHELDKRIRRRREELRGADPDTQGRIRYWLHGAARKRSALSGWLAAQQRGEHRHVVTEEFGLRAYAVCLCGIGFEGRDFTPEEFASLSGHRLDGAAPVVDSETRGT